MNKYIIFSLLFIYPFFRAKSQTPIQSDAIYYQLRSMETGPWEFKPEAYYYSWVRKHRRIAFIKWSWDEPGLGVHDRGPAGSGVLGDRYVKKYAPSSTLRAQMLALSAISHKQYNAIAEQYKKIGNREAIDATDRQINLAIKIYESKIRILSENIESLCHTYEGLHPAASSREFLEELYRIKSNIKFIGSSYTRNGARSKAYLKEIRNLENLSNRILSSCQKAHALSRIDQTKNIFINKKQ